MQLSILLKSIFSLIVFFTVCSNSVRPSLISRMPFSLLITRESIKKNGKGRVPNGFFHSLLRSHSDLCKGRSDLKEGGANSLTFFSTKSFRW